MNIAPTRRYALTPDEIKRLNKLAYELNSSAHDTFHLILKDALEIWANGLKSCKK